MTIQLPEWARSFSSARIGEKRPVTTEVRVDLDELSGTAFIARVGSVDWSVLAHAYGQAADVPALLVAAALGTGRVRRDAWWELWGNVHHQGTVYSATAPAVEYIADIAAWDHHPDRVQAGGFLQAVSVGSGDVMHVRAAVRPRARALFGNWGAEPWQIQRVLLYLASAYPDVAHSEPALVALVPPEHEDAFAWELSRAERIESGRDLDDLYDDADSYAVGDRQLEFETWSLAGWNEEPSE